MTSKLFCAILLFASCGLSSLLADETVSPHRPKPEQALIDRCAKIVAALKIADPEKSSRVQEIVVGQYQDLQAIHAETSLSPSANVSPEATVVTRAQAEARLNSLHRSYLERLAGELTPTQIDQVKDGMTYGVVQLTFRVYQQMMPDLTEEQKGQILAWLVEAREKAMDAGTAKEKHAWFGRYKGRINNYLSAAGYDLKAAEKNLTKKP